LHIKILYAKQIYAKIKHKRSCQGPPDSISASRPPEPLIGLCSVSVFI
jgi:hypothetical protein